MKLAGKTGVIKVKYSYMQNMQNMQTGPICMADRQPELGMVHNH